MNSRLSGLLAISCLLAPSCGIAGYNLRTYDASKTGAPTRATAFIKSVQATVDPASPEAQELLSAIEDAPTPLAALDAITGSRREGINQGSSPVPEDTTNQAGAMAAAIRAKGTDSDSEDYKKNFGAQFAIGPAFIFGLNEVKEAKVVGAAGNETVVITDMDSDQAKLLLEWHYYVQIEASDETRSTNWGVGPFAALALSSEGDILEGLGAGIMTGFTRSDDKEKRSFNIGVGAFLDNNVSKLAPGLSDGGALPAGYTEPLLVEDSELRFMVMLSFRWGF